MMGEELREKPRKKRVESGARPDHKIGVGKAMLAAAIAAFYGYNTDGADAAPGYEHVPQPVVNVLDRTTQSQSGFWNRFRQAPNIKDLDELLKSLATADTSWSSAIQESPEVFNPGSRALLSKEGRFVGNGTVLRIRDQKRSAESGRPQYQYVLVTAEHVARSGAVPPAGAHWVLDHKGRDIAVAVLNEAQATPALAEKPDALHLSSLPRKMVQDISGAYGVVVGHDTDASEMLRRKLYQTTITPRLNDEIAKVLHLNVGPHTHWESTRMIVIPKGETAPVDALNVEASGVSGSPYLVRFPESRGVEFGGIIVSVVPFTMQYTNGQSITYELGFVVDHQAVRETINQSLSWDR